MAYQTFMNGAYNPYSSYGAQRPTYGGYQQPYAYAPQNAPMPQGQTMQPQTQPQQNFGFAPIRVIFANADEARGYMVTPQENALLIDRANHTAYFKTLDNLGQSICNVFTYAETENSTPTAQQTDMTNFAKKEDLTGFATKDDIKLVAEAIDRLQKQIKINNIERSDGNV